MIDSLPKPFPALDVSEDRNPAMRLFGLRFFQDQTVLEYLTEFLSVVSYPKWLADGEPIRDPLPPLSVLRSWSDQKLRYKPRLHLLVCKMVRRRSSATPPQGTVAAP